MWAAPGAGGILSKRERHPLLPAEGLLADQIVGKPGFPGRPDTHQSLSPQTEGLVTDRERVIGITWGRSTS